MLRKRIPISVLAFASALTAFAAAARAHEMPCAAASGGVLSGAGSVGVQNVAQAAVGRTGDDAITVHAGIVPCLRSSFVDLPGDLDDDGDVDLADFAGFADCLFGPAIPPTPSPPLTGGQCISAFDFNEDGDVDLQDFAAFELVFDL